MSEKLTGLESLLTENSKLTEWSADLSSQLLDEKILSESNLTELIKNKILLNESYFYECICSELELKIEKVKTKSMRAFKLSRKKEYIEIGFTLSSLNTRLKKYNIERTKAYQRNKYKKLRDYLKQTGHEQLLNDFSSYEINKIES